MRGENRIGPSNPFCQQLHAAKYRQRGESFDDYCVRYARTTADDEQHFRRLLEGLRTQAILPAGRQQRAVGWPYQTTAFNCFVGGTIEDDTEAIGRSVTEAMLTLRSGGGDGWDFSTLRPSGEPIRGLGDGAHASGPVSFMGIYHAMCNTIRSAGERRGAMMAVLDVHHPDIMTFVRCKKNATELTNFNISVGVTNEFMEAVEHDKLYELRFPVRGGRSFGTVRAVDVWAAIMENNWDWAEPGVLFLDRINGMNPLAYCELILATNPCVPGDTPVLTDQGHKPIAALVGQRVNVWSGHEWSEVVPRQTGANQSLVLVRLSDGSSLRCTPAHKFVLSDGRRVEASSLIPGQRLARASFPQINTGTDVPTAYSQGLFQADGWFDKRGRAYIGLYGQKKALVEHLPYHESVHEYRGGGGWGPQSGPEDTRIWVKLHAASMEEKYFVPDCSWSVKSRLDWLAGLADGDGYVCKDGSLQIGSEDREFLLKVRLMLQTLGTPSRVRKDRRVAGESGPRKDEYRLLVSGWYVRLLAEMGLDTHRLDLSYRPSRNCQHFVTVVGVLPLPGRHDVYCFTEPRRHQGVFNGVLTAQCGEQPLPPNGACLLLSHNLVKYLVPRYRDTPPPRGHDGASEAPGRPAAFEIDLEKLAHDVGLSVRACDNVFEKTVFPLEAQRAEALAKRRMGVGVTGVANAIEICGYRYGTPGYLAMQSRILEVLRDTAYLTSIDMARAKGSFPLFDADKWLASGFARTLPDHIRDGIKRYGLRNGLLLSIAPTGTISLTADNISSGIESPPVIESNRIINVAGGPREVALNDYAFEEYGVRCRTSLECSMTEHVDVLCQAQAYVDSAISKTTNYRGAKTTPARPGEVTFNDFKEVYLMAHRGGAKGCTTFNMVGKRMAIITERQDEPMAGRRAPEHQACEFDPVSGARTCG